MVCEQSPLLSSAVRKPHKSLDGLLQAHPVKTAKIMKHAFPNYLMLLPGKKTVKKKLKDQLPKAVSSLREVPPGAHAKLGCHLWIVEVGLKVLLSCRAF